MDKRFNSRNSIKYLSQIEKMIELKIIDEKDCWDKSEFRS